MSGIKQMAFYFPEETVCVNDYTNQQGDLNDDQINFLQNSKLHTIRVNSERPHDLAIHAGKKLLENFNQSSNEIDYLIHLQSRAPQYLMSSEATKIKEELGLNRSCCFSLTDLGCVNISAALLLAEKLLQCDCNNNILITASSTPFSDQRFRYPVTILGDAGMAVLINNTTKYELKNIEIDSNGKYWDLYSVDYRNKNFEMHCKDSNLYSFNLALESKIKIQEQFNKVLESYELTINEIRHFVIHNLSQQTFDFYEEVLEIEFADVCRKNLSSYGHLGSIDVILNLSRLNEENLVNDDDYVMIINNSPVAAWSNILIRI